MQAAFYDFDGTLASSNVFWRYYEFARRRPGLLDRWRRSAVCVGGAPYWLALDAVSRARFNRAFYSLYRGIPQRWLEETAEQVFEQEIKPKIYAGAAGLIAGDRAEGRRLVLVTGGLDFVMRPAADHLGFDDLLANRMVFENGVATGRIAEPLLAERGKVEAIESYIRVYNVEASYSKAYSDSWSDVPMLECVGLPAAVNPERKLRRLAAARGWRIVETKSSAAMVESRSS